MPININGTTGISGADGSAATPSIQGADTNTGIFFPAADTVAIATGGAERVRVDSSGNVIVGGLNSAGSQKLHVTSSGTVGIRLENQATNSWDITNDSNLIFSRGGTERARIDSSGNLLVGTTSLVGFNGGAGANINASGQIRQGFSGSADSMAQQRNTAGFYNVFFYGALNTNPSQVGGIYTGGTTTSYNTTSDYRLKHDITPMTGALAKVAALKPVTYKWNADDSEGEGFIAHELQEVCPDAVTGEKDAVDADGNPVYQGIDTSFLVATLTAAIQELKAIVDAQAVEIAALKGAA